jgi:hypothetical protein
MEIMSLAKAKQVFYVDSSSTAGIQQQLQQGLYLVQSDGLEDIVDTVWKHDAELGRGFLLLSQSASSGRIWRWEVGGGPIAIGKTLHMEPSGCRSNLYLNCSSASTVAGSGGLAIDFSKHDTNFEGRLVVSEWGEGRMVRMEESGARTPLIIQVPRLCSLSNDTTAESTRRVYQPNALMYTAFGDLIFADYDAECQRAGLYYLDNAMTIDPLSSALESRKAHAWTSTDHDTAVNVFFASGDTSILKAIGGLALDSTWTGLYVTVQTQEGSVQVLHLYLNDDDDEPLWDGKSDVVYEWKNEQQVQLPGPIVVDQKGHLFVGINNEVVVMDEEGTVISTVSLPARATSLTLGQDGFLYVSSSSDLYRIKVRNQPLKVPTNMIKKKQTTK